MQSNIDTYQPLVAEVLSYYGMPLVAKNRGIAVHRVTFDLKAKTFDYNCTEADDSYCSVLNLDAGKLADVQYDLLFPENKENRFDWSAIIGHVAKFNSKSKFYCQSKDTGKWFRFLAFSPEQNKTILIVEDISAEKHLEIEHNIARYGHELKETE